MDEAKTFSRDTSKAGRKVLRVHGPLRYRFDASSGKVRKLDAKAFKALVARSAGFTGRFLGGF